LHLRSQRSKHPGGSWLTPSKNVFTSPSLFGEHVSRSAPFGSPATRVEVDRVKISERRFHLGGVRRVGGAQPNPQVQLIAARHAREPLERGFIAENARAVKAKGNGKIY